jgi:anti-anti-sigma regulatory factor
MPHLNGESPRLQLDPEACATFLEHLSAELQKPSVCTLTIDLGRVDRITPAILQVLRAAGEEALHAGKDLYVDGAAPTVYKALHLAKLGPLVKRLQHAQGVNQIDFDQPK